MAMTYHPIPRSQQAVSASHPNEWTIAGVRLADTILEGIRASSECLQMELTERAKS
jgi:hypothetical protein